MPQACGIRAAWGRPATPDEVKRSLAFLGAEDDADTVAPERLTDFCHVLFNANEFLYVE